MKHAAVHRCPHTDSRATLLKTPVIPITLAFFPFVSPVPLNTDVQPTFFIVALLCILLKASYYRPDFIDTAFFVLIVVSLAHQSRFDAPDFQGFIRFSFAWLAYMFFRLFIVHVSPRLVFALSGLHLLTLLAHFALKATFVSLADTFVRDIKVISFGVRGISGFAPEPGFSGAIAVSLMAAAFLMRDMHGPSRYFWPSVGMGIVAVALTRSGTGSVLLGLFLLAYHFKPSVRNLVLLGGVFAAGLFVIFNADLGRGTSALRFLVENPVVAIQQDKSIGARVLSIIVSAVSVLEFPFGEGIGSFETASRLLASRYELHHIASGPSSSGVGGLSMLSIYTIELGLFWLAFLACLFGTALARSGWASISYLVLSFYFVMTSFSIAFPPTWFFLAACCSTVRRSDIIGAHHGKAPA